MTDVLESKRGREVADAVKAVRARLTRACESAGRSPTEVVLLPVTKFFPATDVQILYHLGFRDFGESRVQEASAKVGEFSALEPTATDVRWHMIGRLQRNKVNTVARWARSVQSVDSNKLIAALDRAVAVVRDRGERQSNLDVYLQVSLDEDDRRGGAPAGDLERLGEAVMAAEGLSLGGLMSVPPLGADPETAFARLREIHAQFMQSFPAATGLSAGMSGDAEIAVRHGSTCVRVGTALLGLRPITSP